jgi:hypothetical protein
MIGFVDAETSNFEEWNDSRSKASHTELMDHWSRARQKAVKVLQGGTRNEWDLVSSIERAAFYKGFYGRNVEWTAIFLLMLF